MLKRLLGLCALTLFPILAASTMLAGGGDAPPAPDAPAVIAPTAPAPDGGAEPPLAEIPVEPEPEFFEAGACGPECTSDADCDGWCGGGIGSCRTEKRCQGRCLCLY